MGFLDNFSNPKIITDRKINFSKLTDSFPQCTAPGGDGKCCFSPKYVFPVSRIPLDGVKSLF